LTGASIHRDLVAFSRCLREAGLPIGIDGSESFVRSLEWIDPLSRRELYLAARATLISRREDIELFDMLFDAFWSGQAPKRRPQRVPLAPRHDPSTFLTSALVSYMAERADLRDPEVDIPEQTKAASALELLVRKDFSRLTPDERVAIERALRDLRFDIVRRRTRRRIPARRGDQIDLRRALRTAARRDGAIAVLPRRRRKTKRRPLVVLADISGSMELYSRILLQFLHGIAQGCAQTETFVFGTRLTRITSQLMIRSVDVALDQVSEEVVDFAGGTRIGESLRTFNRVHARRVLRRGAVLLLISDGWETGDAAVLDTEMRATRRRCHRVVWLNPLLGHATYEPRAAGMSAALAHVDDFLPVHNLQSLKEICLHLSRLGELKGRKVGVPRGRALARNSEA
jgi:uncharacterized protein with von Willebrand factor type A (vWA) domain